LVNVRESKIGIKGRGGVEEKRGKEESVVFGGFWEGEAKAATHTGSATVERPLKKASKDAVFCNLFTGTSLYVVKKNTNLQRAHFPLTHTTSLCGGESKVSRR
jgi:hypothetical protein